MVSGVPIELVSVMHVSILMLESYETSHLSVPSAQFRGKVRGSESSESDESTAAGAELDVEALAAAAVLVLGSDLQVRGVLSRQRIGFPRFIHTCEKYHDTTIDTDQAAQNTLTVICSR